MENLLHLFLFVLKLLTCGIMFLIELNKNVDWKYNLLRCYLVINVSSTQSFIVCYNFLIQNSKTCFGYKYVLPRN